MRRRQRSDTSNKKKRVKRVKKEPKAVTKGVYKGLEYDSLGELAVLQWLFELKALGVIKAIKRADSYLLSDTLINNYALQKKSVSSIPIEQNLMRGHSYTPEFEVIWDRKRAENLVWIMGTRTKFDKVFIGHTVKDNTTELVTVIEVKPSFDQNNMERLFKLNQKWMWDKHGIFVNLVKVNDLFPNTFTPKGFLTTPTGKRRILKWPHVSVNQYVNRVNGVINGVNINNTKDQDSNQNNK